MRDRGATGGDSSKGAPQLRPRRLWQLAGPFAVLLAALAAIGTVLARHEAAARREWRDRLVATAEERKAAVLEYLGERVEDADVFAAFPTVRLMLGSREAGRGEDAHHLGEVFERGRDRWGSVTVALVGSDFSEILRAGWPLGEDLLGLVRAALAESRRAGLVRTSEGDRVVFVSPVPASPWTAPAGWVVIVDDAATKLWPLLRREPVATRSGEVLLVGRVGDQLTFLSPSRYGVFRGGPPPRPPDLGTIPAADAVRGKEGFGEYTDHRGTRVLAATRHLSETGWGLVVGVDAEEALERLAWDRVWAGATFLSVVVALLAYHRSARGRERLRTSEARRQADERHRQVLAQVRDAVIWVRPADGRILEANKAAEALWGWDRAELLRKSILDLRPPEDLGTSRLQSDAARQGGVLFRARHWRRDGSTFPVEVSARALRLDGEDVLVSVVRDVSESEAALEKIRLLNRLLRTISAVDQALVGARDRDAALSRACEEIVATGEFAVAWFGVPDGRGRLVAAAAAGRLERFLEEAEVTQQGDAVAQSGAARAFHEERTVVVGDWATDPGVDAVREAGLRRGFRSSAACPVRIEGAVRGVLALFSSEPGAFVAEAVLLLEELARDLGLALELADSEARRRQAEASVVESEARYRKLFEENPAPMWVFDVASLRFLDVNEAATGLYGWSREEFLGLTLRDIRRPEDVASLEADVLVPRTGVRRSGPWRHRRKDGGELRVEIVTYDIVFEGRAARLALANDVTERAKVEEKLRAFFDSGMAGAIFGDVHGNVLAANDEFLRIVGYTRDDLEGGLLRLTDITPPEWLPLDAARIAEAKERGICTPHEKEYVRKDGRRVSVLVGYALVGERREESVAFILDLTERKEAEARLAETTRLLQAVVEGSPAPILTLDREGRVTSWNPAAEAVFGWSAAEVAGLRLPIVPAGSEQEFESFLKEVGAGRSFAGREVRRTRKDGTEVDVSIAAAPLRDADGAFAGIAAVLVDVSARVKAEEEIRRLAADLEARVEDRTAELLAKSKELESFAYSVSHDLRAPLRAIDGFSRMVEEEYGGRLDDEGRRLLGVVRGNARRMGQLIDDLLAFSRAGRSELRRSRVDVGELVRSVLAELLPEAESGGTDVVLDDLPPVMADPALLRQVFVNLLSNALKFSATQPRRVLRVRARTEPGRVLFDVADNGVGFDMRYAGKLFGVFQRLHGREFDGTGVGLALVERIVSRHGGTVAARGEVGRGATFTIALPDAGGD